MFSVSTSNHVFVLKYMACMCTCQ